MSEDYNEYYSKNMIPRLNVKNQKKNWPIGQVGELGNNLKLDLFLLVENHK